MDYKELRIGNYITYKNGNDDSYVEHRNLRFMEEHEDFIDNIFKFIPLTEEWLLRFGFVKEKDWKYSFTNKHGLYLWSNRNEEFKHTDKNYYSIGLNTKGQSGRLFGSLFSYVHQLQNLYFALTGEELKCK